MSSSSWRHRPSAANDTNIGAVPATGAVAAGGGGSGELGAGHVCERLVHRAQRAAAYRDNQWAVPVVVVGPSRCRRSLPQSLGAT